MLLILVIKGGVSMSRISLLLLALTIMIMLLIAGCTTGS